MDLPFFTTKRRMHHKRKDFFANPPPPVVPLELTSATYVPATSVTLTFNQAIDIDEMILSLIIVADDATEGRTYAGATVLSQTADSVTIELTDIGSASGGEVFLSVDAGNGIVASDGGAEWAGVTELALPFP